MVVFSNSLSSLMLSSMRLEVEYLEKLPFHILMFFMKFARKKSARIYDCRNNYDSVESSWLVIANIALKASNQSNKTHQKSRVSSHTKPRHTCETCWKLHGKLANWRSSKEGERNSHQHASNASFVGSNPCKLIKFWSC